MGTTLEVKVRCTQLYFLHGHSFPTCWMGFEAGPEFCVAAAASIQVLAWTLSAETVG